MRPLVGVCALLLATAVPSGQERDAATVLNEMRQALGGPAVLDGIKSLSFETTGELSVAGQSIESSDEFFLLLPDHYLRVRYGSTGTALRADGFRGSSLISKAARPPRQRPAANTSPEMTALRDRVALTRYRHEVARLVFALMGTSLPTMPLQFTYAGTETDDEGTYDIVEARGPDGLGMRLHVERRSHLPRMVTTLGATDNAAHIQWILSDFKASGGVTWPRKLEERIGGRTVDRLTVRRWRINPKLDATQFDIK